jgi:putative tricarboxylic transport membrane protein
MLTTDRAAGGALVIAGLVAIWESRAFPLGTIHRPGPAYVPVALGALLVLFGALLFLLGGSGRRLRDLRWQEWRHVVAIVAACAFAALVLERLGYRLTVAVILLFLLGVVERQRPIVTVATTVVLVLGSFFLFDTLLRVPLPRGPFGI